MSEYFLADRIRSLHRQGVELPSWVISLRPIDNSRLPDHLMLEGISDFPSFGDPFLSELRAQGVEDRKVFKQIILAVTRAAHPKVNGIEVAEFLTIGDIRKLKLETLKMLDGMNDHLHAAVILKKLFPSS